MFKKEITEFDIEMLMNEQNYLQQESTNLIYEINNITSFNFDGDIKKLDSLLSKYLQRMFKNIQILKHIDFNTQYPRLSNLAVQGHKIRQECLEKLEEQKKILDSISKSE